MWFLLLVLRPYWKKGESVRNIHIYSVGMSWMTSWSVARVLSAINWKTTMCFPFLSLEISSIHTGIHNWRRGIQWPTLRMKLQRRLYGICSVRFLVFRVPCRPKLAYFCALSVNHHNTQLNAETINQASNRRIHSFGVVFTFSSFVGNPVCMAQHVTIFIVSSNFVLFPIVPSPFRSGFCFTSSRTVSAVC